MKDFNPEEFLILVVDDLSKNIQLLMEILDEVGYSTTFALSGKQAMERLGKIKPDLILLDLMMPEINGIQLCEIIKSDRITAAIPIIFLTASNEEEHLINAFKIGAVDYINKPFKIPELLARVKTHIELSKTKKELEKAYEEMKRLANTDPLTGIANRRYLFEFASKELERSKRYENPFSLLIIDLDYFKKINDTYGHDIGDKILQITVNTINTCLRKVDCLGRFGGEEFVVILPETESMGALNAAERIRTAIATQSLQVEQETIKITVSIGVATYTPTDETVDSIIKRADTFLYKAKQGGRNRVMASVH